MKRVSLLFSIAIPVFALIALFNVFTPPVHAIEVGGLIYNDTTWTLANSPYIVTSDLYIDSRATLTIEAGVEVYAEDNEAIEVFGHLNAGSDMGPTTIISGFSAIRFGFYDAFPEGSGDITNTVIHGDGITSYGIEIIGVSDDVVSIKNSFIQNQAIPVQTYVENLHRLQMENVSFNDNVSNQVFISYDEDTPNLNGDVILRGHPGLESYEIISDDNGRNFFYAPPGITLTLEAGTVITGAYRLGFGGHLIARGTLTNPVKIIGEFPLIFYSSGSGDIEHTIISGITHGINSTRLGIEIRGDSNNIVSITNSEFVNVEFPIEIPTDAVQRLQIDNNITSTNNVNGWILLKGVGEGFTKDTTLNPHPGFEGYQLGGDDYGQFYWMRIPSGITLTVDTGATLIFSTVLLRVDGHLIANGTTTSSATITDIILIEFGESGSADINHTILRGLDTEEDGTRISIFGNSDKPISIKNSVLQNLSYPLITFVDSLHRLRMERVSFEANTRNRVFIGILDEQDHLGGDVFLGSHPGLEGYEIPSGLGLPTPSRFVVPNGITLTLEEGISLFNKEKQRIEVNGRFIANGTQLNPVNITSSNDSASGEWGGISVNGGEVILNHTNLRNGDVNLALSSPTSTVTISNSIVISASQSGISVTEGLLNMECSVLTDNGLAGLWVSSSGTPDVTINRTDIWGNGAGITNTNSTFIDARYNWWGASDGPNGDFSGSGDPAFGNILHSPWLNAPNDCLQPPFHLFLPMILAPSD